MFNTLILLFFDHMRFDQLELVFPHCKMLDVLVSAFVSTALYTTLNIRARTHTHTICVH